MKRLYIIRHAKAEDHSFAKRDYDRNLVERGKERAQRIANELKQELVVGPNTLVISSPANRAIQTAEIFSEILHYPIENIQQEKSIYEAYHLDILHVINRVADPIDTLLVFGHNPGLSMLAEYLSNQVVDLKTSNIAYLELEPTLGFSQLSAGTASLKKIFE